MKAQPDCIPCMVRQVLHTARRIADDPWLHRKVVNEIMGHLPHADFDRSPAELVTEVHRIAYKTLGSSDPFVADKKAEAEEAAAVLPRLREAIAAAQDPLHAALKLAGAANVLDSLILNAPDLGKAIDRALESGFAVDDYPDLRAEVERASSVLYVLDSAGEAWVDKLVAEQLVAMGKALMCVVRRVPILNDATIEYAEAAGFTTEALGPLFGGVVDTGADVMGVPLSLCSAELRPRFDHADVVVAKGAANYETLEGEPKEKYFLIHAKCVVVARHLGVAIGDTVLIKD